MITLNHKSIKSKPIKIPIETTLSELYNKYAPSQNYFIFWNDFRLSPTLIADKIKHNIQKNDMTFAEYYSKYQIEQIKNYKPTIMTDDYNNYKLQIFDMNISFKRTLRIPNYECNLHPDLGSFQIYKSDDDFIISMYQKEAIWIELGPKIYGAAGPHLQ